MGGHAVKINQSINQLLAYKKSPSINSGCPACPRMTYYMFNLTEFIILNVPSC